MAEDSFQEILRIQQMMSQRIMQEQKVDHKIDILNIINDLSDNGRHEVQVEAILIEASISGIAERETTAIIDELIKDGMIRKSRVGYIQLL